MPSLKGTRTEQNLKDAFAAESEANGRCLGFARKADVEGFDELAALFRSAAAGRTRHAHGHLDHLEEVGDPATTGHSLTAAIASEPHEYSDMYPGMARMARQEGLADIADWFETLAKAGNGKWHAGHFRKVLDAL
jgi:rubrerythrin